MGSGTKIVSAAVAGLLLGIGMGIAVPVLQAQSAQRQTAITRGRFQIVINPNVRADTFLLDTDSGRTWKPTAFTDLDGEPVVWEPQDRVDNEQELRLWIASHRAKK